MNSLRNNDRTIGPRLTRCRQVATVALAMSVLVLLPEPGTSAADPVPKQPVSQQPSTGQPATEPPSSQPAKAQPDKAPQDQRFGRLAEQLSGTLWKGRFNFDGKTELLEDQYEIKSASKLPNGDFWLIQARIKYGDRDVTLPLPLEIKWADNTPVITVENLTIPGLGTFTSHVLIDGNRYAGTWQHGDVGGHMFGTITKLVAPSPADESPADR